MAAAGQHLWQAPGCPTAAPKHAPWPAPRRLLGTTLGWRGRPRRGARGRGDAGGLGEPPVVGGAAALAAAAAARVALCGEWRSRPVRGRHALVAEERKAGPFGRPGGAFVGTDKGRGTRAGGKRRGGGRRRRGRAQSTGEEDRRLERECGRVPQGTGDCKINARVRRSPERGGSIVRA